MLQYSLEVPQGGASNEYPQHMFLWRNKKIILPGYHPHIWSYEPTVLLVLQWGICPLSLLLRNPSNKINRLKQPQKGTLFKQKILIFFMFLHENIHCGTH